MIGPLLDIFYNWRNAQLEQLLVRGVELRIAFDRSNSWVERAKLSILIANDRAKYNRLKGLQ